MPYNPNTHRRRSVRMEGYDYSQAGMYFVTICVFGMECLLGENIDGKMQLNDAGKIANEYLKRIPDKYHQTLMHEFVVMPNHIHAIIEITESVDLKAKYADGTMHADSPNLDAPIPVGAIHESPLQELGVHGTGVNETQPQNESSALNEKPAISLRDQRRKMLLSKIIGWYKMNTAKYINIKRDMEGWPFWQRSFHDIIIRDEQAYLHISNYIINNPANWKEDNFFR